MIACGTGSVLDRETRGTSNLEKKLKRELADRLSAIQAELLARRISAVEATQRIQRAKSAYEKRLAAIRRDPRRGYRVAMVLAIVCSLATAGATQHLFPQGELLLHACYLASLGSLGVLMLMLTRELRRVRERAARCLGHRHAAVVMDAPLVDFTCRAHEATIIATEVKNHHALASLLDDEALAELEGTLLDYLSARTTARGGVLISAGHGAYLAVFGPDAAADHARLAVETARALQVELVRQSGLISAAGRSAHLGMGISSGKAQLGIVGTAGQQRFVCVGRTTELALELASASAWGEVLLTDDLFHRLEIEVKMQPCEPLRSVVMDSIVRIHSVVIPVETEAA